MKSVTMTIDIVVHDEKKLLEEAANLYKKVWNGDFDEETRRWVDDNKKMVRAIFEVLIGSAPLPYQYADTGIEIVGWSDDKKVMSDAG